MTMRTWSSVTDATEGSTSIAWSRVFLRFHVMIGIVVNVVKLLTKIQKLENRKLNEFVVIHTNTNRQSLSSSMPNQNLQITNEHLRGSQRIVQYENVEWIIRRKSMKNQRKPQIQMYIMTAIDLWNSLYFTVINPPPTHKPFRSNYSPY